MLRYSWMHYAFMRQEASHEISNNLCLINIYLILHQLIYLLQYMYVRNYIPNGKIYLRDKTITL